MIGWDADGNEIELTPRQAATVKALLEPTGWMFMSGGRGWGKSTVLRTAERYDREYCQLGILLPWETG